MLKIIYKIIRQCVLSNLTADTTEAEINSYIANILVDDMKLAKTEVAKVMEVANRTILRYLNNEPKIDKEILSKVRKSVISKIQNGSNNI